MKTSFIFFIVGTMAMCAFAAPHGRGGPHRHAPPPPPRHHHHHHHHHSKAHAIGAGILGAGLIASTIYNATRPSTVVVTQPAVVAPAPVVVAPAPVVVQQPVVATGHYETRVQNVWVEGRYVDQVVNGVVQRVWQPGHYEQQQTQVWVTP
jgi:hypothetical protein